MPAWTRTSIAITGSGTMTDGANSQTLAVSAASFFGTLHVSASSTFNVTNGWALALGYVAFTDDLAITSPTHANGTTNTGGNGGSAFLQVLARDYAESNLSTPLVNYLHDFAGSSVNGTFAVTSFPFIYGTQFEIYFSMQATAGSIIDSGSGYSTPNVTGAGSGNSGFFNTLVVNGAQTDSPDATFNSSSGQTYTQTGVIPEPATLLLAGLAIPVILWKRRRGINAH